MWLGRRRSKMKLGRYRKWIPFLAVVIHHSSLLPAKKRHMVIRDLAKQVRKQDSSLPFWRIVCSNMECIMFNRKTHAEMAFRSCWCGKNMPQSASRIMAHHYTLSVFRDSPSKSAAIHSECVQHCVSTVSSTDTQIRTFFVDVVLLVVLLYPVACLAAVPARGCRS